MQPVPQPVDGQQDQRDPHEREPPPPGDGHLLVQHDDPDDELQDGREVLQQPDDAQREPARGGAEFADSEAR